MQKHKTSVERVEAIRLFHFIQQNISDPRPILNANSLSEFFMRIIQHSPNSIVEFLHLIDKDGREMNSSYWGQCISLLLYDIESHRQVDLGEIHYHLKMRIQGGVWKPLHRYQKWDENSTKTEPQKQQYGKLIQDYWGALMMEQKVDVRTFQVLLSNLNTCFSFITLSPEKPLDIIQLYQTLLKCNFIQMLQYSLTLDVEGNQLLGDFLRMLCYLYTSFKYEKIRIILKNTFLENMDTKWGLMLNINDQRRDVRYYTSVLAALIANNDKNFPKYVLMNNDNLTFMCNNIGNLTEIDGLFYALQFLTCVIQVFGQSEKEWKKNNEIIVLNIFNFAMMVLQNANTKKQETQGACLKLVSECVGVIDLKGSQLKELKIISKVFESYENEAMAPLISSTLNIFINAILNDNQNTITELLSEKQTEEYFKNCLHHSRVLQILLLLTKSSHFKYLIERDFVQSLFKVASRNGNTLFFVSQILLNLVKNSLDVEWMLTYLYEKGLMNGIGVILAESGIKDTLLFNYYPLETGFYFHQQVFFNALKTLYYLTVESRNNEKKLQLYKKNFTSSFIQAFEYGLSTYLNIPEKYLMMDLREEQQITNTFYLKGYKLLSFIIEEMTVHLRKHFIQSKVLISINKMRNKFHEKIYQLLSFHELEMQRIPIYLKFIIQIQNEPPIVRRAHRLTWDQFKIFISDIVNRKRGYQCTYQMRDRSKNRVIHAEGDYFVTIDELLRNYLKSEFIFVIQVFDVREKVNQIREYNQRSMNFPGNPTREAPRSRAEQMDYMRYHSMRIPSNRDLSPYASHRTAVQQRSRSPTFGTLCTQCRRNTTTNRSRICNYCISTNKY